MRLEAWRFSGAWRLVPGILLAFFMVLSGLWLLIERGPRPEAGWMGRGMLVSEEGGRTGRARSLPACGTLRARREGPTLAAAPGEGARPAEAGELFWLTDLTLR